MSRWLRWWGSRAKAIGHSIETALIAGGAPEQVLGIVVAVLVLMPEIWAAVRAGYELGLEPTDLVMLVLTFLVASSTLVSGRTRVPRVRFTS